MQTPTPFLNENDDIIAQRYRIVTLLGQGSMGMTYEAEDLTNYQRVALKVVSLRQMADWKVLELFEREARVLAHLEHPGIPKFIDCFWEDTAEDRRFYLVRELAQGDSLAAWMEKGWRPQESQVRDVARQVLEILDYLHSLTPAVVHRDIKPQNIIRHADGRISLVDFGSVQDVYRNTLTRGGTFVGTLGYMPPEQFFGQVGAASDLYSLGATLLYVLTGESPADLPQRRMRFEFRDRIQVSPKFANWLEKILEPAIEDRFESVKEAADVLQGKVDLSDLTEPYEKFGRVILKKKDRHLFCEIAPLANPPLLVSVLFSALGLAVIISGGWGAISIFALVFVIILSSGIWVPMVGYSGCCRYLEIDEDFLTISLKFGDINSYRLQLNRADISLVDVEVTSGGKGEMVVTLVIWEGINRHIFGSSLNRAEKEWLASKLSDFLGLKKLNSSSFRN